jgi:hypothetical protein
MLQGRGLGNNDYVALGISTDAQMGSDLVSLMYWYWY